MNKGRDNNGRFQREHKESIETKIKSTINTITY